MTLDSALGPGGEFDLIRRLVGRHSGLPQGVCLGPGDDGAVLDGGWVVSTDLTVEDVHFRRTWIADADVGYRAAAAALSDLAAMGAMPVGVLVSLGLPPGPDRDSVADRVQEGVRSAADAVGAAVLGGDLSGSPGPLFVDVVVLGKAACPLLRSGARPGDSLWVTGTLGAAAAAVESWRMGRTPPPALYEAFARPVPRVREVEWIRAHTPPSAAIDLSDGIAGDAGHLAAAGGCKLVLDASEVPVSPHAVDAVGAERASWLALHGGEDYEMLFSAPAGEIEGLRAGFRSTFGVTLTRVGRVDEGRGVWLKDDRGAEPLESGGFDHLAPVDG